jgi:DNA ligase-associated metallophosphoesterase
VEIKIRNNTLKLLPEKAIYWEEKKSLIISDLHLGKITHFRNQGIPVPAGALKKNFDQLNKIMQDVKPKRIIFLGDLFHSFENSEWKEFKNWRNQYENVPMELVQGNHDRFFVKALENFSITIHEKELISKPFLFSHHPRKNPEENDFIISGHVHPVFRLRGIARQSLMFPCFYFSRHQAIMPSFGYFTGGFEIEPETGSRVMIIVNESIKEIEFS